VAGRQENLYNKKSVDVDKKPKKNLEYLMTNRGVELRISGGSWRHISAFPVLEFL